MERYTFVLYILLTGSLISGLASVGKIVVLRDYDVVASVPCDPRSEQCFIGDGENDPGLYKIIRQTAAHTPRCNGWEDECAPLNCHPGDDSCREELCEGGECYGITAQQGQGGQL